MPIRLNLLEGERKAARERGRDPFRISILMSVLILVLAVGSGVIFAVMSVVSQARLAAVKGEAEKEEKERQQAQSKLDELVQLALKQTTAQTIRSKRFLFAPQLQAIKESIPDSVQLVAIAFDWETVKVPNPRFGQKGKFETQTESDRKIPAEIEQQRMRLVLEGYITGDNPEAAMRKFMQQLNRVENGGAASGTVQSIPLARFLQQAELKTYSSISPPAQRPEGSPVPQFNVGRFSITCYYLP